MGLVEQSGFHDASMNHQKMMRLLLVWGIAGGAVFAGQLSFEREVWPIFRRHCVGCHAEGKAKGGLRMDTAAGLQKGGETGVLFVPGKPDESLLISQVSGEKPEMPEKEPPLSAEKVKVLREWIAQGARIDRIPKMSVPAVTVPEVYSTPPAVTGLALSPDGKRGVAACRSEVVLLDVDEGKVLKRIPTGMDLVNDVAFSPDGALVAVSGGYPQQWGGVLFLDAGSGADRGTRKVASDTLFRGEFSPDGSEVAFGGPSGVVYVIPVDSAKPVRSMEIHSDWVMDVAYTPDGKRLVSGGRDKTTKVSNVEEMSLLRSVDESTEIIHAVATDGDTGISGGNAKVLSGYDYKLALAGVEVTGSGNGATPVNKKAQYLRAFEGQAEAVMSLATSGDRKLLAVGTRAPEIRVYRLTDRVRVSVLPKAESPVLAVAIDAAGARMMSGSKSGKVQVWDLKEGKLLRTLDPVPVK